jgi:predicted RNase H-like HicB family nuclease
MAKKFRYTVNIAWSPEDDCFVARVPELKGCLTDGETYEKAARNAQEAIESYVEALRAEKAPVPVPVSEQEFSGKLNLRLGPELHRDVAVRAASEGKSINDILLEAARSSLKEDRGGRRTNTAKRSAKSKRKAG